MKILYHHRTLADGAEGIHISEMVEAFRELGHTVLVSGLTSSERPAAHASFVESFRRWVPRSVFEGAAIASNALEYRQTRRLIREFQPDLVYKRHARSDVGALYAATRSGVPVALEVNCLYSGERYERFEPLPFRRLTRWLERKALGLAQWRFAVSTPLAADIEQLHVGPAIVLPNGTNPVRFDPAAVDGSVRVALGLGSSVVIGWSGVLRDWHGLDLLLDAVTRVAGAHLLIVGDGPARPAVETRARKLGVLDRMTVTGRIAHADMPAYIAAMDIAVVADDRTGVASPMKLLEYMAMERAVVAPRLANVEDVVTDGRDGRLFEAGRVDALAEALVALAADPVGRRRLGAAARQTIVNNRNWRLNAARVLGLATGRETRKSTHDSRRTA